MELTPFATAPETYGQIPKKLRASLLTRLPRPADLPRGNTRSRPRNRGEAESVPDIGHESRDS
ncbi:Hypothetical predicted protein [Pelobates cultripes]|uniref:Uncharacterized protein n=1 Tax=Pelobates cultripes TaxID=61616 RepID=A0AAD1QZF5_PELCU|nr:Hypothetical predicted protein [Pelobates cultripes]